MIAERIYKLSPGQREALADMLTSDNKTSRKLVAWYTTDHGERMPTAELRRQLTDRLPAAVLPRHFEHLSEFPRTTTGKINRQQLYSSVVVSVEAELSTPEEKPTAGLEILQKLHAIWTESIGTDDFGYDDNFFEVGGDSLGLIKAVALAAEAGWELTPSQFHEAPTIRGLAQQLDGASAGKTAADSGAASGHVAACDATVATSSRSHDACRARPIDLSPASARPVLFFLPPQGIAVSGFRHLVHSIDQYDCVAPVTQTQNSGYQLTVEDLAAQFLPQIRRRQPQGPYRLIGTCEGAYIAWELALCLTEAGDEVEFLGLIDTPNPDGLSLLPAKQRFRSRWESMTGKSYLGVARELTKRSSNWLGRRLRQSLSGEKHLTRAGSRMGWRYSPRPYTGRATLFRASKAPENTDFETDFTNGWGAVASGGLDVFSAPCSRSEMLLPEHVGELAKQIHAALGCVAKERIR